MKWVYWFVQHNVICLVTLVDMLINSLVEEAFAQKSYSSH